ncbi:Cytochrome P450 86A2 [Hibiscus syriacus]|uniref:Cytochrome P450 86A2 n=1 Tax=Hibiscus syriacus TaxID=106335 RepID=A0A6A2ZGJ4_HIBSY|nr:Cytochrome P450 86A2 [Hibiscus syriacus]
MCIKLKRMDGYLPPKPGSFTELSNETDIVSSLEEQSVEVSFHHLFSYSSYYFPSSCPSLSTNSRWIVDSGGRRVKLACVNWSAHSELMVAEGLSKQPMGTIAKQIVSMGFNCVRYTWPVYLVTMTRWQRSPLDNHFNDSASLSSSPESKPTTLRSSMFPSSKLSSKPGWCCNNLDDNGFFGDKYFNPDQWITGLTRMATLFNGVTNVVGMSLRNELRGPKQNRLIIHQDSTRKTHVCGKLVFEAHWYGFSDGPRTWVTGNPNEVCGRVATYMLKTSGYLVDQGYPLFISEFGIDQTGANVNGNRYLSCFMGVAAELDRIGPCGHCWELLRERRRRRAKRVLRVWIIIGVHLEIRASYKEFQLSKLLSKASPGSSEAKPHKVIFHPLTGLCIIKKSFEHQLRLGPCTDSYAWSYSTEKTLQVSGTHFCLQADESETWAKLDIPATAQIRNGK